MDFRIADGVFDNHSHLTGNEQMDVNLALPRLSTATKSQALSPNPPQAALP